MKSSSGDTWPQKKNTTDQVGRQALIGVHKVNFAECVLGVVAVHRTTAVHNENRKERELIEIQGQDRWPVEIQRGYIQHLLHGWTSTTGTVRRRPGESRYREVGKKDQHLLSRPYKAACWAIVGNFCPAISNSNNERGGGLGGEVYGTDSDSNARTEEA